MHQQHSLPIPPTSAVPSGANLTLFAMKVLNHQSCSPAQIAARTGRAQGDEECELSRLRFLGLVEQDGQAFSLTPQGRRVAEVTAGICTEPTKG